MCVCLNLDVWLVSEGGRLLMKLLNIFVCDRCRGTIIAKLEAKTKGELLFGLCLGLCARLVYVLLLNSP